MGLAGGQGDLHIRDGRAGEDTQVVLFHQMGEDEPLPVAVQLVLGNNGGKVHTAAPGGGLQHQMDLRIVAQRLKMADALHPIFNGLPIEDTAAAKADLQAEAVPDQAL